MAPAATATRARRAPAPARAPQRRPPLRVVEPRRRPPAQRRRKALWLSLALAVGSLLAVAAAQAYLTQGQVRLARLQQQLTTEEAHHRDLELRVAQLEDPSHVVSQAQAQGLTVPVQVTDLPLVQNLRTVSQSTASTATTGASGPAVSRTTGTNATTPTTSPSTKTSAGGTR